MPELKFEVRGQNIRRTDTNRPVAKNRNYYTAKFEFITQEWTGIKTALFETNGVARAQIIRDDNTCDVPWEFFDTERETYGKVSVFCGDLITTGEAYVEILKSGYNESDISKPPTESVYKQILKVTEEAKDIAEKVFEAARKGEFNGAPGEKGEKGEQGKAGTIRIGNVITGKPGTEASVTNVGTDENAVLDFTIPRGETGTDITPELNERINALQKALITQTVQGTPLVCDDSAELPIRDLRVIGKTKQNISTGAQLLDVDDFETGAVSGTTSYAWMKFKYHLTEGETYTVTNNGATPISFKISHAQGGHSSVNKASLAGSYSFTMTTHPDTPEGSELAVFIWLYSISDPDELIKIVQESNIMLNKGAAALPYEPYTGEAPSPSPDYPQEIISAGKRTANLIDYRQAEARIDDATVEIIDGGVKWSGDYFFQIPVSGLEKGAAYTAQYQSPDAGYWAIKYNDGSFETNMPAGTSITTDAEKKGLSYFNL